MVVGVVVGVVVVGEGVAVSRRQSRACLRLAAASLALVLLSACRVKLDVATRVDSDGSGEVAIALLLGQTVRESLSEGGLVSNDPEVLREILESGDRDALDAPDGPDPVDVLADDVPPGWEYERIKDENDERIQGLVLRASFGSLDELRPLLDSLSLWGADVAAKAGGGVEQLGVAALTRGMLVTRDGPIFRFRAEPTAEAYEGATGGPNSLKGEFSIAMTLPGGIRAHDADEKVDGALVWHIPPGESRSISAVSDLNHDAGSFPVVPVVAGAAVAGLAGLLGLRAWRKRRRAGSDDGDAPEPPDAVDEQLISV